MALDEHTITEALRTVIDPELGINIVDLGLVYDVSIEGDFVRVTMTMTTPACPLGAHITAEASAVIERLAGPGRAAVELVWTPAWTPLMMSLAAKQQLGWL